MEEALVTSLEMLIVAKSAQLLANPHASLQMHAAETSLHASALTYAVVVCRLSENNFGRCFSKFFPTLMSNPEPSTQIFKIKHYRITKISFMSIKR